MSKIYKNQSDLRFELHCSADLSDAASQRIKYVDPDGGTGSWAADVLNVTLGYIHYDVTGTGDINIRGRWRLWAWLNFTSGGTLPGEPDEVMVYDEGD